MTKCNYRVNYNLLINTLYYEDKNKNKNKYVIRKYYIQIL